MMFLGIIAEDCLSMFYIKRSRIGNSLSNILDIIKYLSYKSKYEDLIRE